MRDVKLFNGLLWVVNVALGVGIVLFAWAFLLFPAEASHVPTDIPAENLDQPAPRPQAAGGDGKLKTLRNPVKPGQQPIKGGFTPTLFKAKLLGTLPGGKTPKRGVAFIKSAGRNDELVTYVGEEIRKDGKTYDEFRGWKLIEVSKESAVFSNGASKETLTLDRSAGTARGGSAPGARSGGRSAGTPYSKNQYKSQLLASSKNRHVWGLDPKEIEWAKSNYQQIMDQDFQVTPFAGGGLKVSSVRPGSIGAARGLLAGDVVKNVNGQGIRTIADLKMLVNNPQMKRHSSISLTVERAGKPLVIEYRPLPPGRRR